MSIQHIIKIILFENSNTVVLLGKRSDWFMKECPAAPHSRKNSNNRASLIKTDKIGRPLRESLDFCSCFLEEYIWALT